LQRQPEQTFHAHLMELIREQRRANRLLAALLYTGIGFLLGLAAMQVVIWIRINFS
jgi:ubiquinone biosynthesis protein